MLPSMEDASVGMKFSVNSFHFFWLIIVAVSLTAAGNIINDYFDQKVDRINKPESVIVGIKVKRRVAIVLHQGLNIASLLITIALCFHFNYYWPVLFPVAIATLLWWYSPTLKKKIFIGNLVVALCTAAVPVWAVIFEMKMLDRRYSDMLVDPSSFFFMLWIKISIISFFAFVLTLIREIQKDLEDMGGDKEGGYQTLPIVKGTTASKNYIYLFYSVYLISIAGIAFMLFVNNKIDIFKLVVFVILTSFPAFISISQTIRAEDKAGYHKSAYSTKIVMLSGLIYLMIMNLF